MSAGKSLRSILKKTSSVVTSTWLGMDSVKANTVTSSIRCRISSEACELRSIRVWR